MTQPSNHQISIPNAATRQRPLSLRVDAQIKFHILLEDSECRHITTLESNPLQFIPRGQRIVNHAGGDFQHPLETQIWNLVVECKTLGDGKMITIDVPFNNETGYDWKTKMATKKKCNLWVRIVEVDSVRVAEAADIKANLDIVGRELVYWQKLYNAVRSGPEVFETFDEYWKKAPGYTDAKLIEAKEKFTDAYRAWMKPTEIQ